MSKDFIGASSVEQFFLLSDATGFAVFEHFCFKGPHFVVPVGSGASS